jgi:hypothetical protein
MQRPTASSKALVLQANTAVHPDDLQKSPEGLEKPHHSVREQESEVHFGGETSSKRHNIDN